MKQFLIVVTDNFGGDCPKEKFVLNLPEFWDRRHAEGVADAINMTTDYNHPSHYKVVEEGYQLQSGFEP